MNNKIYFGDNLKLLKKLMTESVDLIYIDPPFNTKRTQRRTTIKTIQDKKGDRKGFKGNTYRTITLGTNSYTDNFEPYIDGFLKPRVEEAYRILKPHGGLYFHIDYREVHYCKLLLDRIFGRDSFLNEIIWAYDYGGRARSKWPAKHDNILFYVKNPKRYTFNTNEIDKEPYMAPGLVGAEKAEKGKLPTDTWWASFTGTNKPRSPSDTWWFFFAKGQQNDTWWQTIVPTGSKERLGYPTQKPRKLIDRIINASSNKGDVVLDFFAGSGTVGASCLELGRNFVLIDNNQQALKVMANRFADYSNIKWVNFDPKPYQSKIRIQPRQESKNKTLKLSEEFIMFVATSSYLKGELEDSNDQWKNSPFEWVLKLPPRKKGKLGGKLIAAWLASNGINIDTTKDASESIVINGHKVAIKFSTLWTKSFYKFQQLRSTGYEYVLCLGISPFEAHCWFFDRKYVLDYATKQHKGGRKSEYWITIDPNHPAEWTKDCGGSLSQAYELLQTKIKK
jgi:site-specific DNA-methyltransferase (adenine-specific)